VKEEKREKEEKEKGEKEEKEEKIEEEGWRRVEKEIEEGTREYKGWTRLIDLDPSLRDPFFSNIYFLEGYSDSSNIYLIKGNYISIIDTGNDFTAFWELFERDVKPEQIKKVFLTHGHNDHTLGLLGLVRRYTFSDLEVIVHKSVSIENLKKNLDKWTAAAKVIGVDGGDTVELSGYNFKVIYTPGHTIDGLCLYHEATKTLFSGDIVLPYDLSAPDDRLGGNMMSLAISLRNLMKLNVEVLLPGHDLPVLHNAQKEIKSTYYSVISELISESPSFLEGARDLIKAGLLEEAIICLDEILEKDPENEEVLGLKGSSLADLGKCEEAIACFDKILKRKPHEGALYGKGMSLLELRRHEEALRCFDEALKLNPNLMEVQIGKGLALIELGRTEEALKIEAFRKKLESTRSRES
jgi:glyoxylase-like metal-dependent hydrolase (beta-lactamase superfamily II)